MKYITKQDYIKELYPISQDNVTLHLNNENFNINELIEISVGHYISESELEVFTYVNGNIKDYKSNLIEYVGKELTPVLEIHSNNGKQITGSTELLDSGLYSVSVIGFKVEYILDEPVKVYGNMYIRRDDKI